MKPKEISDVEDLKAIGTHQYVVRYLHIAFGDDMT